jgi:putative PIN family toxin of toxin-antitoxin system
VVRATFDTSIIVRMVLGQPTTLVGKLQKALEADLFTLILSQPLVDEIDQTLKSSFLREKHGWDEERIDRFIQRLVSLAVLAPGTLTIHLPQLENRDPDDLKVVATAVEGNASFIVTQDKDLLALEQYQSIQIVEPPEFYRILKALGIISVETVE